MKAIEVLEKIVLEFSKLPTEYDKNSAYQTLMSMCKLVIKENKKV